jgi:3-methyladenine DNA glycosylase/8-oxoguanine DNA glycosylase
VAEAFGRSVLEQLVQGKEARRSIAQMVARCGEQVDEHRWQWPTAKALGSTPVWDLRRCGISGRMASALHAGAVECSRLERARHDWAALDRRLRALPGVGPWTSAETRLRLGDPDAVSVGDYHLPTVIGYALSGPDGDGPNGTWTDAGMLQLLAPYAGQRGRVIRLVETAAAAGLVPRRPRRGPRAALSAHRYY